MNNFKSGQWWRCRDGKLAYVHGVIGGVIGSSIEVRYPVLYERECDNECNTAMLSGSFSSVNQNDRDLIEHIPACTGWDWQPEATYIPWTRETCPLGAIVTSPDFDALVENRYQNKCLISGFGIISYASLLASNWRRNGLPCGTLVTA